MEYVFYCPCCQKVWYRKNLQDDEDMDISCPRCGASVRSAKCTKEEWQEKSNEEKQEMRDTLMYQYKAEKETLQRKSYNHIKIIKNIMVFFTVLWIIGVIVFLIQMLK